MRNSHIKRRNSFRFPTAGNEVIRQEEASVLSQERKREQARVMSAEGMNGRYTVKAASLSPRFQARLGVA